MRGKSLEYGLEAMHVRRVTARIRIVDQDGSPKAFPASWYPFASRRLGRKNSTFQLRDLRFQDQQLSAFLLKLFPKARDFLRHLPMVIAKPRALNHVWWPSFFGAMHRVCPVFAFRPSASLQDGTSSGARIADDAIRPSDRHQGARCASDLSDEYSARCYVENRTVVSSGRRRR